MTRPTKALLASVALHVGLVLALIATIPHDGELASISTPRIISAKLYELHDMGDAASERNAGGDADEAPEIAETIEADPVEPPIDRATAEIARTPQQPSLPPPQPAGAALDDPPVSERTVPAPPPSPDLATIAPLVSASVALTDPALIERHVASPDLEEPMPEPKAATIPETERSMLERKVTAFAQRFDASADDGPSVSWTQDGRRYRAELTRLPAGDSMSVDQMLVTVSTEQDGSRWSTQLRMNRLAFSSFAQFIDRWDPSVQIHDDEIDGRFHSNSEIYVASDGGVSPTFRGKVTTARTIDTSFSNRRVNRKDVFLGGLETHVGRIPLPKRFSYLERAKTIDAARVQRFAADTRIVFFADGSYAWQALESSGPEQRVALTDAPQYLVAADKATLYLRGTVNGKVLVYSPADIVIEDDLVYAVDPADSDAADDYLGLVAEKDVEIAKPEVTGPGDLTVHASIYARGRFVVANYSKGERATLSIYGSIASGSVSATEPRFRTKLVYDPRLERLRPPSFPMTDRYEVASWDEHWTIDP